eukprot:gnl/TRDRNA2_/TRDRNA2_199641_c0_seq1.p1 gnl/TRDRNA2_/TRDRNA2_199641_c0~~gnl/TRDRNA2_/TRDRNA2_199641_c0_seq1.p1  ORF type:complete len:222 (+),score=30.81 gnl/TRDRNA2_/TRDRNA2_199641_c0_seq1:81-746(+)
MVSVEPSVSCTDDDDDDEIPALGVPWVSMPPGVDIIKGAREWAEGYTDAPAPMGLAYAPFVVTSTAQIDRIVKLAAVTSEDVVCDLGFGNASVLLRTLATTGCRCIGTEVNGSLVKEARMEVNKLGAELASRIELTENLIENFVLLPAFAKATVIFVHLVPSQLVELAPVLRTYLHAGARVVTQRFAAPGLDAFLKAHISNEACTDDSYFGSLGDAFLYHF